MCAAALARSQPLHLAAGSLRLIHGVIMEREKELPKLINALRRTSRMALQSELTGSAQDTAAFCVEQYNRILARVKVMDGTVGNLVEPLAVVLCLTEVA